MAGDIDQEALEPFDGVIESVLNQLRSQAPPSLEQLCEMYPESADELRRLFPMLQFMEAIASDDTLSENSKITADGPKSDDVQSKLGRYKIEREIGQGGMGTVYLALDTELNRQVALKIPRFYVGESVSIERFRREAKSMAKAAHPNLCPIYDVGVVDGQSFICMAYIEGVSLDELIARSGPLDERRASEVIGQIACAVAELHRSGVLHRDIKPSNIMIASGGKPYLMDFGLARSPIADDRITREGDIVGSPAYLAPEQIESEFGEVGPRSDVYSLGVVLFETVTGSRPFTGSALRVLRKAVTADAPRPSSIRPGISSQFDRICLQALKRLPSHRTETADELASQLSAITHGDQHRSLQSRLLQVVLALAALALLMVAGTVLTIRNSKGVIVVSAHDHNEVHIEVTKQGKRVAVISAMNDWKLELDDGEYSVELMDSSLNLELSTHRVSIRRGQSTELEIIEQPNSQKNAPHEVSSQIAKSIWLPTVPIPTKKTKGEFVDSGQRLGSSDSRAIQLGDLDGDGDLDAFVGCQRQSPDHVWFNNGDGSFVDSRQRLGSASTTTVTLGDVDGDGDLDAFTGDPQYLGVPALWINDGRGRYTASDQLFPSCYHGALGDLDADGDPDLFLACHGAENRVYWNDGSGRYTDSGQSLGGPTSTYVALGDLDGDSDFDAFVCNNAGQANTVLWNDGHGTFSPSGQVLSGGETVEAKCVDWNDDGALDVVVCQWNGRPELWLNDGRGTLTLGPQNKLSLPYTCIATGDCDGDQDEDLLVLGATYYQEPIGVITRDDPLESFEACSHFFGAIAAYYADLGDLDGDGDLDAFLVAVGGEPDQVWFNRNPDEPDQSLFAPATEVTTGLGFWDVALADFDQDDDVDLFVSSDTEPSRIWWNDGNGRFEDSGQTLEQELATTAIATDLDGDDDVDLFVLARQAPCRVWLNQGNGQFRDSGQRLGKEWGQTGFPIDIDRDGDDDVCVISHQQDNLVWINDGRANFTRRVDLPGVVSLSGGNGDINSDGNADIVVSPYFVSEPVPLQFWFGDGEGGFAAGPTDLTLNPAQGTALFDLNGDGNLDLFSGGRTGAAPNRIFLGDGKGGFTETDCRLASLTMIHAVGADLDLDGDVDVVTGNEHNAPNQVLLNDGEANLLHGQWLGHSHSSIATADLDSDGDPDIVEVAYAGALLGTTDGGGVFVWLNKTRGN